jgi:hypothetical protein
MGAHGERLLHAKATAAAILRGELGWDGYHWDAMDLPIIPDPGEEHSPTGIADGLCQMVILDQMGDLEVFKSYQVARPDQRSRGLDREIFPPPLDPQIPCGKPFDRLFTVLGPLDCAGDAPMQALEFGCCFASDSAGS